MAATITSSPNPFLSWYRNSTSRKWNYLLPKVGGTTKAGVDLIPYLAATKPLGVEVWDVFDVPHDQVDPSWKI